ncbi:MAG: glycine betaine/L-proline ABC transporter substrate-binding protein ProX [Nitriliruptorales bacterium]
MRAQLIVLLGVIGLLLAACGGGDGGDVAGDVAGDDGDTAPADDGGDDGAAAAQPGEGVSVTMGRANWDTGYMQSHVFKQLLEELGYSVSDPSAQELGPAQYYPALAQGESDFWVNGWFPLHDPMFETELPTGETVGDKVSKVGFEVEAGALQGYLVDKKTADELGITSMSDFNDPEIAAVFDDNGNGTADLMGCDDGWGCNATINTHLEQLEWGDSVEQIVGSYSALMADVVARVERGEPALFYTWTPNWTVDVLKPGGDVVWIESPELPEEEGQTSVPGLAGCVTEDCQMGWTPNDIRVVASNEFLEANPAAAQLFELVEIPLEAIAEQNGRMNAADSYSEAQIAEDASAWIEANRDLVDGWLEEARAAT